jgi:Tfp pilus assembly protein PilO
MKMFFRERQQITIFVIAAAIIGGFVLIRYLPLQKRIRAAKGTGAARMVVISKGEAEGKQLPVLKEQKLSLQQAVANFDLNIPAQRALGGFLQRIADLVNEHNLGGQVVTPGEEIRAGELNCIPLDIQCKGRLAKIFEFYKQLQSLDRLVRVEQVKLENDGDFSGEVTMRTKAVIYYRAEVHKS